MEADCNFHNIHISSTQFVLHNPFSWPHRDFISELYNGLTVLIFADLCIHVWAQSPLYKYIFNVRHTATANRGHCPVLQLLARPYKNESWAFKLIRAIFYIWRKLRAVEYLCTNIDRWKYNRVQLFKIHKNAQSFSLSHLCTHNPGPQNRS